MAEAVPNVTLFKYGTSAGAAMNVKTLTVPTATTLTVTGTNAREMTKTTTGKSETVFCSIMKATKNK